MFWVRRRYRHTGVILPAAHGSEAELLRDTFNATFEDADLTVVKSALSLVDRSLVAQISYHAGPWVQRRSTVVLHVVYHCSSTPSL